MYESLIRCCEESELLAEASHIFTEMRFCGVEPSECVLKCMISVYCKMGFPETAHCLINQAESKGFLLNNHVVYVDVIAAYGKVKLWQKAESVVRNVRQRSNVDRKIWNALIQAYAASGCYE
ncbi:hypothetical protein F3Y22_tig00110833pilonHSYRG00314 [Hibiscus syriacus]|uniref:Pentatricopeptide repeat-containing protein n=1 Tax=Hibiscus syriacus TaxID=106335 RepID=A0A6A2ZLX2_HIBSY|nr:hypothetical protein F3Y22_tig00110833pilonHSYRG00314 [Hibiscus syriacus]